VALVDTISVQRARKLALNGFLVTGLWSVLSLINLSMFGHYISLLALPLLSIFLWPRLADPFWSVAAIFTLGIILDLMTGSILGLRGFLFVVFFVIFRPDRRDTSHSFTAIWLGFVVSLFVITVIMAIAGFVILSRPINISDTLFLLITSALLFPFVYWVTRQFGRISSDVSGVGYAQ